MSDVFEADEFMPAEVTLEALDVPEATSDGSEAGDGVASGSEAGQRDLHYGGRVEPGEILKIAVRLPLFVLTAPAVSGCKTTMTSSESKTLGWALELKLFGNGVSLGHKITVSWGNEVSAGAGRANEIFLPVFVEVQEFTRYFDNGREEQHYYEVSLLRSSPIEQRVGVRTLAEWVPPRGPRVQLSETMLADLSEGDDAVKTDFDFESQRSGDVSVGFKAFGADQTLKIEASTTRTHALSATLAPGHNYRAAAGVWPPFVEWTVDAPA